MTSDLELPNPFQRLDPDPWQPAARRELSVFGAPVELLHLPERKARGGVPSADRPAFRPSVADRILAEESLWRGRDVVMTPNKFPFGAGHALLWTAKRVREAPLELLEVGFAIVSKHGGTLLGNCIGSAASIQRAHVHLVAESRNFLGSLRSEPWNDGGILPDRDGVELLRLCEVPFAGIGVRGEPGPRARVVHRLLELRMTPAFNLIDDGRTTWVFPRRVETPRPHFPAALGAAELWGRWCYGDEAPFRAAEPDDLEHALELSGAPPVA